MFSRRKFVQSALASVSMTSISAFLPKSALAQTTPVVGKTFGSDVASGTWASVTDPGLFGKVWGARFTNVLPWALDRSNTVLAKALNGVALNPATPAGIGFVYNPDPVAAGAAAPVTPTYTHWERCWHSPDQNLGLWQQRTGNSVFRYGRTASHLPRPQLCGAPQCRHQRQLAQ
jgi:hypothetical protein